MKRVLVPCASGVATSTMAAEKLKALCRDRHLEVEVQPVSFKELERRAGSADLIVTIAPYERTDYRVPVLNGIPLLTGMGLEALLNQVETVLAGPGTTQRR
jgi:PTS system galactitol-specific IIB component